MSTLHRDLCNFAENQFANSTCFPLLSYLRPEVIVFPYSKKSHKFQVARSTHKGQGMSQALRQESASRSCVPLEPSMSVSVLSGGLEIDEKSE